MSLFKMYVQEFLDKKTALLSWVKDAKPVQGFKVPIDLSVARSENDPLVVSYAFKSVFMPVASDPSVVLKFKPVSKDADHTAFPMNLRDSFALDYQVPQAFIHWDAQPGKTAELMFFADGEFRSGSQLSVSSGGVSITEGASASGPISVTLAANTAGIIAPQNFNRKAALLQNKTGADLFIAGDNTVNATTNEGLTVPNGGFFVWKNTAALWGFSVLGGKVTRIEES